MSNQETFRKAPDTLFSVSVACTVSFLLLLLPAATTANDSVWLAQQAGLWFLFAAFSTTGLIVLLVRAQQQPTLRLRKPAFWIVAIMGFLGCQAVFGRSTAVFVVNSIGLVVALLAMRVYNVFVDAVRASDAAETCNV